MLRISQQPILHALLGIDNVGSTGNPPPDNKVDDFASILDTARGLLVFRSLPVRAL
jgi:hypothetical protein